MTATIPDIDTIGHLDWRQVCQSVHSPCDREAEWALIKTCGCDPLLYCTRCRDEEMQVLLAWEQAGSRLACLRCNATVTPSRDFDWRPL